MEGAAAEAGAGRDGAAGPARWWESGWSGPRPPGALREGWAWAAPGRPGAPPQALALAAEGVRWPRGGTFGGPPPSRAGDGCGGAGGGLPQGQALWASRRAPVRTAAARGGGGREAYRQSRLEAALLRRGLDPLATRREWARVPRGGPEQKAALDAHEAERRARAGRMRRRLGSDEERQEFLSRLGARDDGDYGAVPPEAWLLLDEKGGAVTRFNTTREELIARGLVDAGRCSEGAARERVRAQVGDLPEGPEREAADGLFREALAMASAAGGGQEAAGARGEAAPPFGRGRDDGPAQAAARLAGLSREDRAEVERHVAVAQSLREAAREAFPGLDGGSTPPGPSPAGGGRAQPAAPRARPRPPPPPRTPSAGDASLNGGGSGSNGGALVICDVCGRGFAPGAIARHQRMCRRVAQRRQG